MVGSGVGVRVTSWKRFWASEKRRETSKHERVAERMTKTAGPMSLASSRDCSSMEPKRAMATWAGLEAGYEAGVGARVGGEG